MNRQNRNCKRPSSFSTQPIKQTKLSSSRTPSPNSDSVLPETGNTTHSQAITSVTSEDKKTLFYFLLETILSHDRTLTSSSSEWVTDVRLAIDANSVDSVTELKQLMKKSVPLQDTVFRDMVLSCTVC